MKKQLLRAAALLAVAVTTASSGLAQPALTTYSPGDLFLGLRQKDAANSLAVKIGPATQFLPASLGGTISNNAPFKVQFGVLPGSSVPVLNLNTDLTSVFTTSWTNNPTNGSGVRWAVVGQTDDTLDNTPINGLKARSIFVTRARTSPTTPAPPLIYGDTQHLDRFAQQSAPFAYGTGGGAYVNNRSTVNSSVAFIGSANAVNNWNTKIQENGSFGLGGSHRVEQAVLGNFTGPTDSVLDLFLAPRSGSSLATATSYLGSFTLYKNGELIYWPAASNTPAPVVNVAVSPINGSVGTFFQYQIRASNFPSAYDASNLPAGLSLDPISGLISGTPTQPGTSDVTLIASNPFGSSSATLKLVFAAGPAPSPAPQVTSETVSATVGKPFSYNIKAINSATSYGAAGLPSGLSINAATGRISGIPTTGGKRNVTITASNASGSGSGSLTLNVGKGTQSITFNQPPLQTFRRGNTFRLAASANSRLPVTFVSSNSQVVSVRGNIATILKPGTVRIVARQTGNLNYLPAKEVARTVVVSQSKPQSVTFAQPANQTFRKGKTFKLVASASSRLPVTFVSGNPQVVSVRGNIATILKPGTVRIVARQTGNAIFAPAKEIPRTVVIRK